LKLLADLQVVRDRIARRREGQPEEVIAAAQAESEEKLRDLVVAEYTKALEYGGDSDQVSIARRYVARVRSGQRRALSERMTREADGLLRLGKREDALGKYEQAVALDDTNVDALFSLGLLQVITDRHAAAIGSLESVLVLQRDHLGALFNLARAYAIENRKADARRVASRFLELAEKHPAKEDLRGEMGEARRLLEVLGS
jgi:tetratricopeptide (TPR) repeat protein